MQASTPTVVKGLPESYELCTYFVTALQALASCSERSISSATAPAVAVRVASRLCVARSAAQRPVSSPLGAGLRSLREPALVPAQQAAGFQHSAVCSATATEEAPAETFQYQAEVRRLATPPPLPPSFYWPLAM